MFFNIKLKTVIAFILSMIISLISSIVIYRTIGTSSPSRFNYTIVIDAGHGARDAGCSGINSGVKESDINLKITLKLRDYLEDFGFNVILTRDSDSPLYSQNATNHKREDMEKREEIIKNAKADMVISIHQNSYPEISQKGAQAFFNPSNKNSKSLSETIQKQLKSQLVDARENANSGDYYILNISDTIPISIVECGFLTNPDEEILLSSDDYQSKIAYAIMCGVVEYYGLDKIVLNET